MKLTAIKLQNFRSYFQETVIDISDFTTLIGKNDAGKSTTLEALEIFFNSEIIKPDLDDLCKFSDENWFSITCCFNDLPNNIVIDDSVSTAFDSEYLLNEAGELEIKKVYSCTTATIKPKVYLNTVVPNIPPFLDLVTLNNNALKALAKDLNVDEGLYQKTSNVSLRNAIRSFY
ncbi:AAA family ATPase [Bacillus toyonensis]